MQDRYGDPTPVSDAARVGIALLLSAVLWPLLILKGLEISTSKPVQPEIRRGFVALAVPGAQENLDAGMTYKLSDPVSEDNFSLSIDVSFYGPALKEKVFLLTGGASADDPNASKDPKISRCAGRPSNILYEDAELTDLPANAQLIATRYAREELLRKQPGAEPGDTAVSKLASELSYTLRTVDVEHYMSEAADGKTRQFNYIDGTCFSEADPWILAQNGRGVYSTSIPSLMVANIADRASREKVETSEREDSLSCSQSVTLGPDYAISTSDPAVTSQRLVGENCASEVGFDEMKYQQKEPAALVVQQQSALAKAQQDLFLSGVALGIFGGLVVWSIDPILRLIGALRRRDSANGSGNQSGNVERVDEQPGK